MAAGRPVVFCGQSTGGGHCFVLDGYDGKGYFHVNWGWGGSSNGYFKVAILNPEILQVLVQVLLLMGMVWDRMPL